MNPLSTSKLNNSLVKTAVICLSLLSISACSSSGSAIMSETNSCRQIGCGEGLVFYPNEEFAAQKQARRWYGFEWGQTSSAYPPGHPKHQELLQKEIQAGQTPWHWNQ